VVLRQKITIEKGAAHGGFRALILLFLKDPTCLHGLDGNGNMQIKRQQLNPEKKKMPSATVPYQYLLIDTTSYPPSSSWETTFKKIIPIFSDSEPSFYIWVFFSTVNPRLINPWIFFESWLKRFRLLQRAAENNLNQIVENSIILINWFHF